MGVRHVVTVIALIASSASQVVMAGARVYPATITVRARTNCTHNEEQQKASTTPVCVDNSRRAEYVSVRARGGRKKADINPKTVSSLGTCIRACRSNMSNVRKLKQQKPTNGARACAALQQQAVRNCAHAPGGGGDRGNNTK